MRGNLWRRVAAGGAREVVAAFLIGWMGALLAGCDSDTLQRWGLQNETPLPPRMTDLLCDAGRGSTCNAATLGKVLDAELTAMVPRPGSVLRVWTLGEQVSETEVVVTIVSPSITRRGRQSRAQAIDDFVSASKTKILAATAPRMKAMRERRRSPIAESISRIALASALVSMARRIVVLSDGREVGVADLECGELSPIEFLAALDAHSALAPRSLNGIDIDFTYASLGVVDRGRCEATLERALKTRELWRAAFKRAGARSFTYRTADEGDVHWPQRKEM